MNKEDQKIAERLDRVLCLLRQHFCQHPLLRQHFCQHPFMSRAAGVFGGLESIIESEIGPESAAALDRMWQFINEGTR